MTINDFKNRGKFWGDATQYQFEGESIGDPYNKHLFIFNAANILEIGPGDGRQFSKLKNITNSYSIADIASKVLNKSVYKGIPKYFIRSYNDNLNVVFDVIAFWYVFHHVTSTEVDEFFAFLKRHLKSGGYIYFNMPGDPAGYGKTNDNGFETTLHNAETIQKKLTAAGFEIKDTEFLSRECFNILAVKL